jgi:hypothetical protein
VWHADEHQQIPTTPALSLSEQVCGD